MLSAALQRLIALVVPEDSPCPGLEKNGANLISGGSFLPDGVGGPTSLFVKQILAQFGQAAFNVLVVVLFDTSRRSAIGSGHICTHVFAYSIGKLLTLGSLAPKMEGLRWAGVFIQVIQINQIA